MFLEYIVSNIPGLIVGSIGGAVGMFFIARKNPKWVEETYQKQKGVLSTTELSEKLKEAEKKLADLELDKKIEAKIQELLNKAKG